MAEVVERVGDAPFRPGEGRIELGRPGHVMQAALVVAHPHEPAADDELVIGLERVRGAGGRRRVGGRIVERHPERRRQTGDHTRDRGGAVCGRGERQDVRAGARVLGGHRQIVAGPVRRHDHVHRRHRPARPQGDRAQRAVVDGADLGVDLEHERPHRGSRVGVQDVGARELPFEQDLDRPVEERVERAVVDAEEEDERGAAGCRARGQHGLVGPRRRRDRHGRGAGAQERPAPCDRSHGDGRPGHRQRHAHASAAREPRRRALDRGAVDVDRHRGHRGLARRRARRGEGEAARALGARNERVERGDDLAHGREASRHLQLDGPVDDGGQRGADLRAQLVGGDRVDVLVALARDELVGHKSPGKLVGLLAGRAEQLLGGHVAWRPHEVPFLRPEGARPLARRRGGLRCVRRRAHPLGQPEVEDLDRVVRADQDVLGLDVAVDEAHGVRGGQRARALPHPAQLLGQGRVALRHDGAQRPAVHQLHRDEGHPVDLADVVDRDGVGVAQRGRGAGLAEQARRALRVLGVVDVQELERHVAPQHCVAGAEDAPHPTLPEERLEAVATERRADRRTGAFPPERHGRVPVARVTDRGAGDAPVQVRADGLGGRVVEQATRVQLQRFLVDAARGGHPPDASLPRAYRRARLITGTPRRPSGSGGSRSRRSRPRSCRRSSSRSRCRRQRTCAR